MRFPVGWTIPQVSMNPGNVLCFICIWGLALPDFFCLRTGGAPRVQLDNRIQLPRLGRGSIYWTAMTPYTTPNTKRVRACQVLPCGRAGNGSSSSVKHASLKCSLGLTILGPPLPAVRYPLLPPGCADARALNCKVTHPVEPSFGAFGNCCGRDTARKRPTVQ